MRSLKFKKGNRVRFKRRDLNEKYGELEIVKDEYFSPCYNGYIADIKVLKSNHITRIFTEYLEYTEEPKQEKLRDKGLNIYEVITYLENAPVDTVAEMDIDGLKTKITFEDGDLWCFDDTSIFDVDTHVKVLNATFDIVHEEEQEEWIRISSVSEAIKKFTKEKKYLKFTNGTIENKIKYNHNDNIFEILSAYPLEDVMNFEWYYKK